MVESFSLFESPRVLSRVASFAVATIEATILGQLVSAIHTGSVRTHVDRVGFWGYDEERWLAARSESQVKQTSFVVLVGHAIWCP